MLGVMRNKVILQEYDDRWKEDYEKEKQKILKVCGDIILNIKHVGSTSVPGFIAKPLIDIAMTIEKRDREALIKNIEFLDYEFKEEIGPDDKLYFVKRINMQS